jgi:hypothetical protein
MMKSAGLGFPVTLAAGIACTAMLGARPAAAASFSVNTTTDSRDHTPGNGFCRDSSGRCSFRPAVEETNATPNAVHVILLGATTYTLSLGELPLRGNQIIRGTSKNVTIVQPAAVWSMVRTAST